MIYNFPNGQPLRYCYKYEKGNGASRFRRTTTNSYFYKSLNSNDKTHRPMAYLDSSHEYPLLVADIDRLDDRYSKWDEFSNYLENSYSHIGLVTRTPSNKVKIYFQLHCTDYEFKTLNKVNTLEVLLADEDFQLCDTQGAALKVSFLTEDMVQKFKTWNPTLIKPVIDDCEPSYWFEESQITQNQPELKYPPIKELIAQLGPRQERALKSILELLRGLFKRSKNVEKIAHWLLYSACRLKQEMKICQKALAQLLEVKQPRVNLILKKLIQNNLLKITDDSYQVGKKSKTYKATGRLLQILSTLEVEPTTTSSINTLRNTIIIDGSSNNQYLQLVRQYHYLDDEVLLQELMNLDKKRPIEKQRDKNYFETIIRNNREYHGKL